MPAEPLGPVVVGMDGSPLDAAVVDLAAREAAIRAVPLVVVHGVEALAARSPDACLLVIGHHGGHHGGHRDRRSGGCGAASVVARLLDRAETPVMLQRRLTRTPGPPAPPVLVCVDGTPGSEAAVEFAFVEAGLRGAALLAMHVWPPAAAARGDGPGPGREEAESAFADLVATWSDKYPDVPVRRAFRHGLDAAIVLTAASRSAQLAVVGFCRPVDHRVSTGPALSAFIDRAECPVTVVPWSAP
jgi:nucleotide-binding universal stress UspA family protein